MKLAGKILRVSCFEQSTKEYCKDYLVLDSLPEDYCFIIGEADIEREKDLDCNKGMYGSVELSCLYRMIVDKLAYDGIALFHCSSFSYKGSAYCVSAHSGVGKSTHVGLLKRVYGDEISYINDDKPLLRFSEDGIYVYGTPWDGKERRSNNVCYPLKGIAFLSRSESNSISKMNKREAYKLLLEQVYIPRDKEALLRVLPLLDRLLSETDIYDLRANMELNAAKTTYEGVLERKAL